MYINIWYNSQFYKNLEVIVFSIYFFKHFNSCNFNLSSSFSSLHFFEKWFRMRVIYI